MIRNYFKVLLRQLKRNKGFSLLNVFGLSIGLTAALLILLWIQHENSYNRFHAKYETLYQVMDNQQYDDKIFTFASTPGPLAAGMKTDFPEVANTARMYWGENWLFTRGDKTLYEDGNYVDPSFFSMFSFQKLYGDLNNPLPNDHSMVLTESVALKYFGTANAVGQTLRVNNKEDFTVTAVVADPPQNSSIKFGWLVNFHYFEAQNEWTSSWRNNGMMTYAELKPGTDYKAFNKKLMGYVQSKEASAAAKMHLLPMDDWRLRSSFENGVQSGGRIEYVRLFSIIAILLVVIACINFMNLATARSEQRAKEVGVRKVMGAKRSSLLLQFIGESVLMSVLATVLACLFVLLALPWFNALIGKKLTLGFDDPKQWLLFGGIAVLSGLLAGSYPALFLSAFRPMAIFRGRQGGGNSRVALVRKSLVVLQFTVSIVLIISTVVIYRQLDHVMNRNLGYDKEHLVYMRQTGKINERLDVIENDLLATGVVEHAASSNQRLLQIGNNSSGFDWEGKEPGKEVLITNEFVSRDYIATAGMHMVKGTDFTKTSPNDSLGIIINETFARMLRVPEPVGATIMWDTTKLHVIGVVQDFVYNDMFGHADPLLFVNMPRSTNYLLMRLKAGVPVKDALAKVEAVFHTHNPGYPFEYEFTDQEFAKLFESEMLVGTLARLFAFITILVSCFGLFGLAAYTAERRSREISIRKILGASVSSVTALLSLDFLKLVFIAIVLAIPIAWYFMYQKLQEAEYRIDLEWWMFALAGVLALVVALLTVSFQAIRAAVSNPIKNIRTE